MALTLPGKQVPIVYFRYFEKFFLSLISDSIFVNARNYFKFSLYWVEEAALHHLKCIN